MRRASKGAAVVAAVLVIVLAGATVAPPPAASGGGSVLVPDRDHYVPGDAVHLTADVRKLDLDWFGPYTVSLRPATPTGSVAMPGEDPTDVTVGRLVVTRMDPTFVRAEVTFVLPKLADGEYWIQYCNPGCTKSLGDLNGGFLRVGDPPVVPTTTSPLGETAITAPPLTTAPPTSRPSVASSSTAAGDAPPVPVATSVPTDGAGELRWWLGGALALVALVAALVILARRRGDRRTVTTSSSPPEPVDDSSVAFVDIAPGPPSATPDETIGAGR